MRTSALAPYRRNAPARSAFPWTDVPFAGFDGPFQRLFDELWREFPRSGLSAANAITPRVDIAEADGNYVISLELPGVDQKDVEVTLHEGVLSVSGELKSEEEKEGKKFHLAERSYGEFVRRFTLPADVDGEKVSAAFDKGVLTITLPRTETVQPVGKKIDVKTA